MTSPTIVTALLDIHPDLGQWATDLHAAGVGYPDITERLRKLVLLAEDTRTLTVMTEDFPVTTVHLFTPEEIGFLLCGEFEGNDMASWISGAVRPVDDALVDTNWYTDEAYIGRPDFSFTIVYDDPEGEGGEGAADGNKTITRNDIVAGLELMAVKSPDHFADLISEGNADAITYDVAMQYIVLGEVVYG